MIVFSYDEATNKVVVTGGTEGTPATFADFVTADRAGTAELLAATLCALNMTLTYQIRPVENLALQINFILSGTSAGAGDTLDITGTAFDGSAQSESIDVSGGDGTYNGSKKWRTIIDIDCTGWADGTLQVTQDRWGIIWDYDRNDYRLDANFDIGDGSTETHFAMYQDILVLDYTQLLEFNSKVNSIFYAGTSDYSSSITNSSTIYAQVNQATEKTHTFDGKVLWYGLKWVGGKLGSQDYGTLKISGANSIVQDVTISQLRRFQPDITSGTFERIIILRGRYAFYQPLSATYSDITIRGSDKYAVVVYPDDAITFRNLTVTDTAVGSDDIYVNYANQPAYLIDCDLAWGLATMRIGSSFTSTLYRQNSCNIHIADKDGNDISGATITCEDKDGNEVFSVNTDANGDIAEQVITREQYYYSGGEQVDDFSPHKFTISKAGYETIELDNITVDDKINWHLELLLALAEDDVEDGVSFGEGKIGNLEVPPENDVRDGIGFGANGIEKSGSLDLPVVGDVEKGVTYDGATKIGTFKKPDISDVRDAIKYGKDDIEFEGTLDLPAEADVEDGVKYDNESKEGTFEVPAEKDVEVGVGYGAGGSEFEGTYLGLKGDNLTAELEKSVDLVGHLEK